jgi:hypothetical protein
LCLACGLALLACNTLERWALPAGPGAQASLTAVPLTAQAAGSTRLPGPTRLPEPTLTPGPLPTPGSTLAAPFGDLEQFRAAMRPEYAADVEQFAAATRYVIDVTVTFEGADSATLTGSELVRYTNRQDFALAEIDLMLWPNGGEQYLSEMTLSDVEVDGKAVSLIWANGRLTARLPLAQPLKPGAHADVQASFSITAHSGVDSARGARFGLTNAVLLAPTFYPLIPRIVKGAWQTMPAPAPGDTTNSDTALYLWRVTAPAGLAIAATGTVVATTSAGGAQTQIIVTGPMRDLALAVGPLQLTQRTVDDITINAWMLPQHASQVGAVLDSTAAQIRTLQKEVGDYPFGELDVVDAPGAWGGVEYPGEVFIGVVGQADNIDPYTAHETGHQWFYSVVGDDQLLEPWLDEAAASYTEVLYEENVHGRAAAQSALREFKLELALAPDKTLPIGLPVASYASADDYFAIVYDKGALFFDALRQQLGDDVFFAFLHNYYAQYRYGFVSSTDFQASAEKTCGCNLSQMFDVWVYHGGPMPQLPTSREPTTFRHPERRAKPASEGSPLPVETRFGRRRNVPPRERQERAVSVTGGF